MSLKFAVPNQETIPVKETRPQWMLYLLDACTVLLLSWYLVPLVRGTIRAAGFAVLLGLWFVLSLFIRNSWMDTYKTGIWLLAIWVVVYVANFLLGRTNMFAEYLYVMVTAFAPVMLFVFYMQTEQADKLRIFLRIALVLFVFTGATTAIGQVVYPNSARFLSTGRVTAITAKYNEMNIANYGFAYSLMLLSIPLAAYAKTRAVPAHRLALYALVLFFFIVMLLMQFTTAILFAVAGIMLILLGIRRNVIILIGAVAFGSLALFFMSDILYISHNSPFGERINNILHLFQSGNLTGDLLLRTDKYWISIDTLLQHPLAGVGGYYGYNTADMGIGGHAEFFDMIARYGIIGTLPLVAFYAVFFNYVIKLAWEPYTQRAMKMVLLFLAVLSFVNVLYNGTEIGLTVLFIIPSFAVLERPDHKGKGLSVGGFA